MLKKSLEARRNTVSPSDYFLLKSNPLTTQSSSPDRVSAQHSSHKPDELTIKGKSPNWKMKIHFNQVSKWNDSFAMSDTDLKYFSTSSTTLLDEFLRCYPH